MVRVKVEGTYEVGYTAQLVDPVTGESVAHAGPFADPGNAETAAHMLASELGLPLDGVPT